MGGFIFSNSSSQTTFGVAYQNYFSNSLSLKCNGFYESIAKQTTSYKNYIINPEALYTVFGNKNSLYLNVKSGVFAGTGSAKSEIVKENQAFFGVDLGLSVEMFILPKFKIDLDVDQRFYQKALFANYRYGYTVSLLYFLN